MSEIYIEGQKVTYYKPKELPIANLSFNDKDFYKDCYAVSDHICTQLNIQNPDIAFSGKLRRKGTNENESILGGYLWMPEDVPGLKKPLIIVSLENYALNRFIGSLAHEHRHLWQHIYEPAMNKHPAAGFTESLAHPAEIDADGYAIWYVSNYFGISIEKAAEILCPEEKRTYPEAFKIRILKAREIN